MSPECSGPNSFELYLDISFFSEILMFIIFSLTIIICLSLITFGLTRNSNPIMVKKEWVKKKLLIYQQFYQLLIKKLPLT